VSGPILIVEDDAALVRTLVRNLEARGYATRSASTTGEAIRALGEGRPRLLLLDIDLPDAPGWDVVRELHRRGWSSTPVIVVSALRPNPRLVSELQCTSVLEKPFPMESLVRLVRAQLSDGVSLS